MLNMLAWTSRPDARHRSIAKLIDDDLTAGPGCKIVGSWHGVAKGFVLVQTDEYAPVIALCLEWADYVDVEVIPVIDHEDALILHTTHR
jgi:hypothetical protein